MVTVLGVVPLTTRFDGELGELGIVGAVVVGFAPVVGTEVVGGDVVGAVPTVAVRTGVVTPLARTEYRYGVFGSRPMSVKALPLTVAIRCPDRSTS